MIVSKRFASVIALLVAFIMLFSVLFVALEADHDCCGEDCNICAQIQVCEDLLRNLLMTMAVLIAAWSFCALIFSVAAEDIGLVYPHTLITLKVKLSD